MCVSEGGMYEGGADIYRETSGSVIAAVSQDKYKSSVTRLAIACKSTLLIWGLDIDLEARVLIHTTYGAVRIEPLLQGRSGMLIWIGDSIRLTTLNFRTK